MAAEQPGTPPEVPPASATAVARRPRLLVVTHVFPAHRGGIEIAAQELVRSAVRAGMDVTWAASSLHEPPSIPGVTAVPIRSIDVTNKRLGFLYPLPSPRALARLTRLIASADILHLHDSLYISHIVAASIARRRKKPVVLTQHIGLIPYRNPILRWCHQVANRFLGRLMLGAADQVVFLNDEVARYFSFVRYKRQPLRIPNGVARSFQPPTAAERVRHRAAIGRTSSRPLLLFAGRFVEKKGLAIVRELAAQFEDADWLFVGRGPVDPASWKLPNVTVAGSIPHEEMISVYQAADLLVLPAHGEGFPLVVQEAMASGVPVLISEEVAEAVPGIEKVAYVAARTPADFAGALRTILASPDERARRTAAGSEYARAMWDWDAAGREYDAAYQRLLAHDHH